MKRNSLCFVPLLTVALAAATNVLGAADATPPGAIRCFPAAPDDAYAAVVVQRNRRVYHSPQTPGFTCWVGLWTMPDGSVMTSFTQATGPLEGRPMAPLYLQLKLANPVPGLSRNYDMTGLEQRNVHLRSADGGETWARVSADAFETPVNSAYGEAELALPDGTILREIFGEYLPYNPEFLATGYIQASHDGSLTWDPPRPLLDPARYKTRIKRLRRLRDGRLLATGGVQHFAGEEARARVEVWGPAMPLLAVSSDGGRTWTGPIDVIPPGTRGDWTEEWDAAELPNGDLLASLRRPDPDDPKGKHIRWQGLLRKDCAAWDPAEVAPAPFPHSGHPELLVTREGPILYIAQSGIYLSSDSGTTWHSLGIAASGYYPHAVELQDGLILVLGHVGGDDAYGAIDQSIVMDTFRLKRR